jgi:MYXO-CTERM domain-containing protein
MSFLWFPWVVAAHVGGIPTQADFQSPKGVGNVADQSYTFTWRDNDLDPTGKFEFHFQDHNVPPNASLQTGELDTDGGLIPCSGATQCDTVDPNLVIIKDATNQLTWDTSALAAGSYVVYAVTKDPPLQPIWAMATGVITVQHAGDPLYPAALVTAPGAVVPPVADSYAIKWEASGAGPLTATVRWRAKDGADPNFTDLVTDVPMIDEGGGIYQGCAVWDLSAEPDGYYFVQVEVKDAAGHTHLSNGRTSVVVYRDPQPTDAGPPASCADVTPPDAGPGMPDAGMTGGDDTGGGGPGCGCRTGRTSAGAGGLVVLAAALSLVRRRRRG